jgi:protein-disulfide isomerase
LKNQYQQNLNNNVQFTPTFFVGEFSYPKFYDKKDILLYTDDLKQDIQILI